MTLVRLERRDAVALVTLDNPPLNLLSVALKQALAATFAELARDGDTRAVVLAGAGERAFSAGSNVREFPDDEGRGRAMSQLEHDLYDRIDRFPSPVFAALGAATYGGGLELAMACDVRVAADDVRLGLPEVKLGVFPSGGGTQRLPRLVGEGRAKLLMLLGETVSAAEAERIGLVDRVVPPGRALPAALEMAEQIVRSPAPAVRAILEAVDVGLAEGRAAGFAREQDLIARVFLTDDAREGVAAFLAKREPRFRHR
jgi:enoyl-CoA hydratase/carnithine racemase